MLSCSQIDQSSWVHDLAWSHAAPEGDHFYLGPEGLRSAKFLWSSGISLRTTKSVIKTNVNFASCVGTNDTGSRHHLDKGFTSLRAFLLTNTRRTCFLTQPSV